MPQAERSFDYLAFLSYRTSDARQAAWLHRTLETYVVPRDLVGTNGDRGPVPKRLGRIFRDRDEARTAEEIETVIRHELSKSDQLIVLCTPAAAAEESWVTREIELFRQERPGAAIHAVIAGGTPPACFPAALLRRHPDGRVDAPLAADIRSTREAGADGPHKGAVRLIAGLLGIPFDDLWRREERRRRARRLKLSGQLGAAAIAGWLLVLLVGFYRSHVLVDVDVRDLASITQHIEVATTEEAPEQNRSVQLMRRPITSNSISFWAPASNLIIRVQATYRDGAERAIAFHVQPPSGLSFAHKRLYLSIPSAKTIAARAGMAYVPKTTWRRGRDNESSVNSSAFWIDVRPPTIAEYVPVAERLLADGHLPRDVSLVLTARQQQSAVKRTGLEQLHSLNKNLGEVFGIVSQANSQTVSASGDIVAGLITLPCEDCPAPMTRTEAEIYCRSRGMRLPTAGEWELAVRGVDGRVYPWGNRFDSNRANVPGLPQKGEPRPALAPVLAYASYTSPFGLIDTVGNAGDWVENDIGSYERVYMGATYRYNPEDATAFRMLPVTDADYLVQEITARCVVAQ